MPTHEITLHNASSPALPVFPLGRDQYLELAGEWFGLDLANGDARQNTITTYLAQVRHWLSWCQVNQVDPGHPTPDNVKGFRRELVLTGAAHDTIALKLTAVRMFYESAVHRGLLESNPAKFIRPPKNRAAADDILKHLETEEANRLFQAIPKDGRPKSIRDRAMLALMTIGGLRRSEVQLVSKSDIKRTGSKLRLLIHGKGKDRYKHLRPDVIRTLDHWMEIYKTFQEPAADGNGVPIFVALSKGGKPRDRITLDGISKAVNEYFIAAGLRQRVSPNEDRQRSCHSLRHTYGTELWRKYKDLKIVQEELGHTTVNMAARYSHVDNSDKANFADGIDIEVE